MKRMLYYILLPIVLITLSVVLFMNFAPQFGGTSKGDYKARLEASPQYMDGKFVKPDRNQHEHRPKSRCLKP